MDPRIETAILTIRKGFREELSLEKIAGEAGLSKFHFHRLFKAETGQTPLHYTQQVRLEHAAHFLIMYPHSKQLDVAFECGYTSPSVFSRAFRAWSGLSPSAYRKSKTGENATFPAPTDKLVKVPLRYLPHRKIRVQASNLLPDSLETLYQNLMVSAGQSSYSIGFFLDAPFHKAPAECRYYAGLENDGGKDGEAHFLEIEEGYYAHLEIRGDFQELLEQVVRFKAQVIDPSPYYISNLTGLERIKLPADPASFDYFDVPRTIFMRIKRM